jgi:hypothetical protein
MRSERNVRSGSRVTISLRQAIVDAKDSCRSFANPDQKIFRLNVAMQEQTRVQVSNPVNDLKRD